MIHEKLTNGDLNVDKIERKKIKNSSSDVAEKGIQISLWKL